MRWLGHICTLGIAAALGMPAFGQHDFGKINGYAGSGVEIWISGCWSDLPPSGMAPLNIRIRNDAGKAQSWTVSTTGGGQYRSSVCHSEQILTVEAATERTFQVLSPLPSQTDGNYTSSVDIRIAGAGIATEKRSQSTYRRGTALTPFVAMSEMVHARSWAPLETYFGTGKTLTGAKFRPEDLPTNWRGFAGVAVLWISDEELISRVGSEAREALLQWVATGGALCIAETNAGNRNALRLPALDKGQHGFGRIFFGRWDGKELPAGAAARSLATEAISAASSVRTELQNLAGKLTTRFGFIMLAICLFAIVVGPVNLFVFARGTKRYRLLFTTPLISLGASGMLMAVILLQDGTGGTGARMTVVHLMPESKYRVAVQEQVARTGLLMTRDWQSAHETLITQVSLADPKRGSESVSGRYRLDGETYSGDWFASRRLQAHFIESIQPSRARVELLGEASAPVIVSHVEEVLSELYYTGSDGKWWKATTVRAGERRVLQSVSAPEFNFWWAELSTGANGRMQRLLDRVEQRSETFYAAAEEPDKSAIDTLGSIRWQTPRVLFVGPVTPGKQP